MPLVTIENLINAYPERAAAMEQAVKIWEQKAKGQQEEFNAAVKGQQDMMMAILGQCDEPTKAQVQAHEDFANIMDEGRILDFIEVLWAICYDTSASGLLFQPMHVINRLLWLLKFDNCGNNMHDYVDDLKNYYALAKVAGFKFPMGTVLLIHLLQIANPVAENNQALWDVYIGMNTAAKTAIKLSAKNHDLAMIALHNSCMPDAVADYAKSYMQGNVNAYPTTAKAVARNLTNNYKVVLRNNQKPKKKPTNQSNKEDGSETGTGHAQENGDGNQNQGTQGAQIIVNNESCSRKSYTINQMPGAHPVDHPIWNLNSTMSDKEEEVNEDKLLKKIDHLTTTDNNQDFQKGRH